MKFKIILMKQTQSYSNFKVIPISQFISPLFKVSKGAKIRNRYNQVPHLAQDTNG